MDKLLLDWSNMDQYSAVPIGYRFVDRAEVIPGIEAWGKKAVSTLDWYFKIHFPGNPVMPGVFLMELMQQTGMLIVTTMPEAGTNILLFHACESMRMYGSARPGDLLSAHVVLESFRHGVAKFSGEVTAFTSEERADTLVCRMRFSLVSQEEISSKFTKISNGGG